MDIKKEPANSIKTEKQPCKRIWELDLLRGICVALMVLDHVLFDIGFVFCGDWFPDGGEGIIYSICCFAKDFYWEWPVRIFFHYAVVAGFIFSCGISCSLSRSNLRRGLILLGVALALSAVTFGMDMIFHTQSFFIKFGVLHMLAVSILVYAVLQKSKARNILCLALGAAILAAALFIDPQTTEISGFIPFALGISNNTWSGDYFPIIPWLGWVLIGAAAGSKLYKKRCSLFPKGGKNPLLRPFRWLGTHALIIYVLHQPLIYGILLAAGALFS